MGTVTSNQFPSEPNHGAAAAALYVAPRATPRAPHPPPTPLLSLRPPFAQRCARRHSKTSRGAPPARARARPAQRNPSRGASALGWAHGRGFAVFCRAAQRGAPCNVALGLGFGSHARRGARRATPSRRTPAPPGGGSVARAREFSGSAAVRARRGGEPRCKPRGRWLVGVVLCAARARRRRISRRAHRLRAISTLCGDKAREAVFCQVRKRFARALTFLATQPYLHTPCVALC